MELDLKPTEKRNHALRVGFLVVGQSCQWAVQSLGQQSR